MDDIGPLQILAIAFGDPQLDGRILESLADASDAGVIKIVDLLGVYKDESGELLVAEMSDLTEDEAMVYGAWVGALIGLGAGGAEGAREGAVVGALAAADEYEYGLSAEDVAWIADEIPAGGAAMLLVIDHQWAVPFRNAVRDSGGVLLAQDFLSPAALIVAGAIAGNE